MGAKNLRNAQLPDLASSSRCLLSAKPGAAGGFGPLAGREAGMHHRGVSGGF